MSKPMIIVDDAVAVDYQPACVETIAATWGWFPDVEGSEPLKVIATRLQGNDSQGRARWQIDLEPISDIRLECATSGRDDIEELVTKLAEGFAAREREQAGAQL